MGIKNTKTYKRGFKDGWEQAKREAFEIARTTQIGYIQTTIAAMECKEKQMTDSEKLARWQGFSDNFYDAPLPDYPNNVAACDSLLDTLIEKGFAPRLEYDYEQDQWLAVIFKPVAMGADCILHRWKPTRREAIIATCLEVAKRELGADEAAIRKEAGKWQA